MTPGEASEKGQMVSIDHPVGGERIAAHVFDIEGGGVAWIEAGWTTNIGGNPCHYLRGAVHVVQGMGWLLITPEGDDVAILRRPGTRDGSRDKARGHLAGQFNLKLTN